MGRYYTGDIEGKFWFGVQASDDGEFFGMVPSTSFIDYYIDESDIDIIEQGIKECKVILRGHLTKMDKFFRDSSGYTNKQLSDVLNVNEEAASDLLKWYARLLLGKQIHEQVLSDGCCYMNAEL
tara:strand:+ start:1650 stop:2021 length:372 start_codon:yes stop_codon:yes gene_type:complete